MEAVEAPEETEPIIILDPEQEELGKLHRNLGSIRKYFKFKFPRVFADLNHGRVGKIENLEPLTQLRK